MLTLTTSDTEYFDDATNTFSQIKGTVLQLEHSLVSISKWEAKWCKPFLEQNKTGEEIIDYVRCMTINTPPPFSVYRSLNDSNIDEITQYINAPMTATTFSKIQNNRFNKEIITSEIIYYWMVAQQIPFECQKWHLNRLLTLIRVCSIKNTPAKKMGKSAQQSRMAQLNKQRRAQLNTTG